MNNAVGLNVAAVTAADSFFVGGNWGFVLSEDEDFNRTYELLCSAGNSVRMTEVSNGVIVFVDHNYFANPRVSSWATCLTLPIERLDHARCSAEHKQSDCIARRVYSISSFSFFCFLISNPCLFFNLVRRQIRIDRWHDKHRQHRRK